MSRRDESNMLSELLRNSDFYVRRHAYEYVIGYDGRILGVIELSNSNSFVFYFNALAKKEFWKVFEKLTKSIRRWNPNATVITKTLLIS